MDGPRDCHTEWSNSDREGEISYAIPYLQNLKRMIQMNLLTSQIHRLKRMNLWFLGEVWGEGTVREFGMDMYTLLYLKWVTSRDLMYSIWNSAQCYVAAWVGSEYMHTYDWVPLLFTWNYHNIVCWLAIVAAGQSLSCVWLFLAPGTVACQAPLSSTIFQNLLKLMSLESVMISNHPILCHPLFL